MEKRFICTKGWKRHSKGTIITEWEYNKLANESKEQFFEEYKPEPEVIPEPVQEVPVTDFQENLTKELKKRGVDAKFQPKVVDGKTELDAKFTFDLDKND